MVFASTLLIVFLPLNFQPRLCLFGSDETRKLPFWGDSLSLCSKPFCVCCRQTSFTSEVAEREGLNAPCTPSEELLPTQMLVLYPRPAHTLKTRLLLRALGCSFDVIAEWGCVI